jgi:hypothetical protein
MWVADMEFEIDENEYCNKQEKSAICNRTNHKISALDI